MLRFIPSIYSAIDLCDCKNFFPILLTSQIGNEPFGSVCTICVYRHFGGEVDSSVISVDAKRSERISYHTFHYGTHKSFLRRVVRMRKTGRNNSSLNHSPFFLNFFQDRPKYEISISNRKYSIRFHVSLLHISMF
jgi:hypothetical protein